MFRDVLIGLAAATVLAFAYAPAAADPITDVGNLISQCEADQQEAKCAAQFWQFADLTGDNKLTIAEITRFFRLVVERQAVATAAQTPAAVDPFEAVAVTFLMGPIASALVIDNFDYNGNGTIEREEVFADSDEDAFTRYVFDESKKLPERAGSLMLRALQAGAAVRGPVAQ